MKGTSFIIPMLFCISLFFSESQASNSFYLNLKQPRVSGEKLRKGTILNPDFQIHTDYRKPAVTNGWDNHL